MSKITNALVAKEKLEFNIMGMPDIIWGLAKPCPLLYCTWKTIKGRGDSLTYLVAIISRARDIIIMSIVAQCKRNVWLIYFDSLLLLFTNKLGLGAPSFCVGGVVHGGRNLNPSMGKVVWKPNMRSNVCLC